MSCKDTKKDIIQVVKKSAYSVVKKHESIIPVQKKYQSKIDEWREYENLNEFLQQYFSISPNDAVNNSRELNDLTKSLNDSIKPTFLENPAFNARINLLYNETLRLYDMSSIPAIRATEINEQVSKILSSYSSVNSKINTLIKQDELENNLEGTNLDDVKANATKVEPTTDIPFSTLKKPTPSKSKKMKFFEMERFQEKKRTAQKTKKEKQDVKKNNN